MIATLFDENPALRWMAAKLQRARAEGQLVLQPGDVGYASAPSNIALLKYWGKQSGRRQIPVNSSLSMTLSGYRSFTSVTVQGCFDPAYTQSGRTVVARPPFVLQLNQKDVPMPAKMEQFLKNLLAPYAPEISLRVSSINNFPTACGVASSASGYAALVAAVADVLNLRRFLTEQELHTWLVEWSRLGSGSATRSALLMREADQEQSQFENNFVAWELKDEVNTHVDTVSGTETYHCNAHGIFKNLKHCLLVIDSNEKATSSSEGHELAQTSHLQQIRLAHFPERFQMMRRGLETGDFECVSRLSEWDAFEMHAVMGTGAVPLHYLTAKTAKAIRTFVEQRHKDQSQMFWTLDAGANPHFLFNSCSSASLAGFFRSLMDCEEYQDARVLLAQQQVPNGLIVGLQQFERFGLNASGDGSEHLLHRCDLQTAAEILER